MILYLYGIATRSCDQKPASGGRVVLSYSRKSREGVGVEVEGV